METKICKKCRYYDRNYNALSICTHNKSYCSVNLVNGIKTFHTCDFMRCNKDFCGPEGNLFEPKQPMAKRIRNMLCRIK